MSKKLRIDPHFKNLIQPLAEDELQQLEQNMLTDGCRDTIKAWRDYIIDGHNRYEICQKHGIPYKVQRIPFVSKADAKIWIADNQLGRRNLTTAMKIEIARQKTELLGQGGNKRKQIAQAAGVSEKTVHKYMMISGSGSAELIAQVKNGEVKIDAAHKALHIDTRTVEPLLSHSHLQYVNMVHHTNGAGKMYEFLGEYMEAKLDAEEVGVVKIRLQAQLRVIEGIVESLSCL